MSGLICHTRLYSALVYVLYCYIIIHFLSSPLPFLCRLLRTHYSSLAPRYTWYTRWVSMVRPDSFAQCTHTQQHHHTQSPTVCSPCKPPSLHDRLVHPFARSPAYNCNNNNYIFGLFYLGVFNTTYYTIIAVSGRFLFARTWAIPSEHGAGHRSAVVYAK